MTLDLLLAQGPHEYESYGKIIGALGLSGVLGIACVLLWRQMIADRAESRADLAAANARNDAIQEARIEDLNDVLDRLAPRNTVPGGTSTRDSHG